jgi:protein translocase SecG subunit
MGVLSTVLAVSFVILCIFLIIIILLQTDKSSGMGVLGGSSQSAFGSSTADVITKITAVMVVLFFLGVLGLVMIDSSRSNKTSRLKGKSQVEKSANIEEKKTNKEDTKEKKSSN